MKRIVALLLAVFMIFALVGCGAEQKPDVVVSKFCDALKKFDFETMRSCVVNSDDDPVDFGEEEPPEKVLAILKENAGKVTYTIGESTVTEETGTVVVDFSYPDVSDAVTAAMGEYFMQAFGMAFSGADEETMEALLEQILVEKLQTTPTATAQVSIRFDCVKTEDGWKIKTLDDEVVNILLGNMVAAFESIGNDFATSGDMSVEN